MVLGVMYYISIVIFFKTSYNNCMLDWVCPSNSPYCRTSKISASFFALCRFCPRFAPISPCFPGYWSEIRIELRCVYRKYRGFRVTSNRGVPYCPTKRPFRGRISMENFVFVYRKMCECVI